MARTPCRKDLLLRFWRSASGFWRGDTGLKARLLVTLLVVTVLLQLWVQYRLNFWSRDFFNAIEHRSGDVLKAQVLLFIPLAAASLSLTLLSVWGRMTVEREWRHWLSNHLYEYWLQDSRHARLKLLHGDHQTPEYRIAEDARVATDLPIDLALGLLSSLLTATAFIGVLWSVGSSLCLDVSGLKLTIPGYLVLAATSYSLLQTSATFFISRQLTSVVEQNKNAEAELRATGAELSAAGEAFSSSSRSREERHSIGTALDKVISHWRALCWQMIRMACVSQTNLLIGPSIGLLVCAPKYLEGEMTLGALVQASAAFVAVQGAFGWAADNYGRLAEWTASASRVAALLVSLDRIGATSTTRFDDRTVGREGAPNVISMTKQLSVLVESRHRRIDGSRSRLDTTEHTCSLS